jgi:N-methylhydantoinase B
MSTPEILKAHRAAVGLPTAAPWAFARPPITLHQMDVPDPILLQLTRSLLEAAAEDMGTTLQRVSFSANIKERRDFSCALFDATGRLLAQAAHIPVHLGSMPASVRAVLDQLPPLVDGNVAVVNDPYAGGSHLPDITLVSPIYFEKARIGYAACRAHHADVGGITPGSMALARHIDEEGHRMAPAILYTAYGPNALVMDPFLKAVRNPAERLGDLDAQLAANTIGVRAVQRLASQFGARHLADYSQALLDYSAAFMARAIAAIPPGVYRFEDVMDGDGFDAIDIPIRVKLTVGSDRVIVDLTETADAVTGPINCPRAVACSAAYYCFCCLMDSAVPLNEGCFSAIEVVTRPGSLVDARYPSPVVAGNTETSQRIVDVIFGALAQALPARIPAASSGTMSSLTLGSRGGAVWTYYETIAGGAGAGPKRAGAHAVHTHMTNTLNTPAEALEMQYPLCVLRFERSRGSGGTGQHLGGDGAVREIEMLGDVEGTVLSERRTIRAWGLGGGAQGAAGMNTISQADGAEQSLGGKAHFVAGRGAKIRIVTPGGGGWGG